MLFLTYLVMLYDIYFYVLKPTFRDKSKLFYEICAYSYFPNILQGIKPIFLIFFFWKIQFNNIVGFEFNRHYIRIFLVCLHLEFEE